MRTDSINYEYPIWVPSFKGHSPAGRNHSVPQEVESSPIYIMSHFIRPIGGSNPTGGILNTLA